MDFSDLKIIVATRSMSDRLYKLSQLMLDLPFQSVQFKNTSADGYIYELINLDVDYVINIDEDAFVFDNEAILILLKHCIENDYYACGLPDGGVITTRQHNPLVLNPFFNIFNIRILKNEFHNYKIENYIVHRKEFEKYTPYHLMKTKYTYDNMFEPFYPFFVWLSQSGKILYLNAENHKDKISTLLKNHEAKPFLIHTWYARRYGNDILHTLRINKAIKEAMILKLKKSKMSFVKILFMTDHVFFIVILKKIRLKIKKMLKMK